MTPSWHNFLCSQVPVALLVILAAAPQIKAQATYTLKAETHLIDSTLSVRDEKGALMEDLTPEDFEVVEDGVPQTIRFFHHDQPLPLSIGLLVDVSGSQSHFIKAHEQDLERFLAAVVGPSDEAFAVCFGNHLRLVSDLTPSTQGIVGNIHSFDKGDRHFPELGPEEERDLGTALYDAVYFGVVEKLTRKPERRKVVLILSDGEDNSSEHDLLDAIEAAQNEDVLVYAIRYTELHHGKMDARDRYGVRALDHLAEQTGGRVYDVARTPLPQAFREMAGELRSLYGIAYQSTNKTRDGRFRNVTIRSRRPGLVIRSRAGYYAR